MTMIPADVAQTLCEAFVSHSVEQGTDNLIEASSRDFAVTTLESFAMHRISQMPTEPRNRVWAVFCAVRAMKMSYVCAINGLRMGNRALRSEVFDLAAGVVAELHPELREAARIACDIEKDFIEPPRPKPWRSRKQAYEHIARYRNQRSEMSKRVINRFQPGQQVVAFCDGRSRKGVVEKVFDVSVRVRTADRGTVLVPAVWLYKSNINRLNLEPDVVVQEWISGLDRSEAEMARRLTVYGA